MLTREIFCEQNTSSPLDMSLSSFIDADGATIGLLLVFTTDLYIDQLYLPLKSVVFITKIMVHKCRGTIYF